MVKEWLKRNYDARKIGEPTWQRLVEAVSNPAGGADMAFARDMAKRHKAGGMTSLSHLTQQVHSDTHEPSKAETFKHENRQTIITKFAAFQTNVCNKLFRIRIDIRQFRLFVVNQFPPGDCIPPLPTSLTEIFEAITHHGLWDYFHYSPLVRIAEKFGGDDSEIKGWVQTYKKDLKSYRLATTVVKYIEADLEIADPPAKRAKYDPRYYRSVEWKTEFIDHSLDYLAEVWELFSAHYLVPDYPPTALLDRIRRGCFSVTWLVPSGLIPTLIKQVKIDTGFFKQYRILRVTVGDKCVYEEVTEKSTLLSLHQVGESNMQEERCSTDTVTSIGDVRKTSNGCKMAKHIPRMRSGFRVPSGNIAAIDFGTTNCSVAYTIVGSRPEGPQRLLLNDTHCHVPTAILFMPDGSIHSFGYKARAMYLNLVDFMWLKCAYFEQIKMTLQHDENVNRELKVRASNGTEYYLVDVIAQILKYLKVELIENHLKCSGYFLEATDFDWVITVPAIWKARGKQMMREAGYKAGLCSQETCGKLQKASVSPPTVPMEKDPDKLSLALEPECAAIYCQSMSSRQQVAAYCPAQEPFQSTRYLVVDIGGGTVDISAHRLRPTPDQHLQVVHPPTGNDCGGSKVNKEFEKFLEKLVNDKGFSKYLQSKDPATNAKHSADLNELVNKTFERLKVIFGIKGGVGLKAPIHLPFSFLEVYRDDIDTGIQQMKDARLTLVGQDLQIDYSMMVDFFQPVVEGMLECISQTLRDVKAKVDTICLVGGFGGSKYIYKMITERFGDSYKYITPAEPDFAVIHGAVRFRQYPDIVRARKVDATYGVGTNILFDPLIHNPEYKWADDDGEGKCSNLFSAAAERGDLVCTEQVFKKVFWPTMHQQTTASIPIYSTLEKDVWYTTGIRGKGSRNTTPVEIRKIGELQVQMPIMTGDKDRKIDVVFDFSHTEIHVKAYDSTSGIASFPGSCAGEEEESLVHTVRACARFPW